MNSETTFKWHSHELWLGSAQVGEVQHTTDYKIYAYNLLDDYRIGPQGDWRVAPFDTEAEARAALEEDVRQTIKQLASGGDPIATMNDVNEGDTLQVTFVATVKEFMAVVDNPRRAAIMENPDGDKCFLGADGDGKFATGVTVVRLGILDEPVSRKELVEMIALAQEGGEPEYHR